MKNGIDAKRNRRMAAGLLLLALPATTACVTVAEFRKLEHQVKRLRGGEAGSQVADFSVELEAVREDLSRLEGRLEVSEHETQRALQEAQAARQAAASGAGSLPYGAPPAPGPAGGYEGTGVSPDLRAPPPGAEDPWAAQPRGNPAADLGRRNAAPAPAPAAVPAPAASAELRSYRGAYDSWRTDQNQACIDRFGEFLQTFPSSDYADDASYWMADCYFKQGEFKTAILRFDDVVTKYPQSDKASEALFRQGEALLRLGPSYQQAAGKAFERIITEYPSSRRAREASEQLNVIGVGNSKQG